MNIGPKIRRIAATVFLMTLAGCCPTPLTTPETNLEIDRNRCMEDYYHGFSTQACARAMAGFAKRLEDKKSQKTELDDAENRRKTLKLKPGN
jgi:hypothetical protein